MQSHWGKYGLCSAIQFYNKALIKNKGPKNKYFLKFMMLRYAGAVLVIPKNHLSVIK